MDLRLKYEWQQAVMDAFVELDPEHLSQKITAAERAIAVRLSEPELNELGEQLALLDALQSLWALFPDNFETAEDFENKKWKA